MCRFFPIQTLAGIAKLGHTHRKTYLGEKP
jgi:hypothetical protein